jgi:hypothetical protein
MGRGDRWKVGAWAGQETGALGSVLRCFSSPLGFLLLVLAGGLIHHLKMIRNPAPEFLDTPEVGRPLHARGTAAECSADTHTHK